MISNNKQCFLKDVVEVVQYNEMVPIMVSKTEWPQRQLMIVTFAEQMFCPLISSRVQNLQGWVSPDFFKPPPYP